MRLALCTDRNSLSGEERASEPAHEEGEREPSNYQALVTGLLLLLFRNVLLFAFDFFLLDLFNLRHVQLGLLLEEFLLPALFTLRSCLLGLLCQLFCFLLSKEFFLSFLLDACLFSCSFRFALFLLLSCEFFLYFSFLLLVVQSVIYFVVRHLVLRALAGFLLRRPLLLLWSRLSVSLSWLLALRLFHGLLDDDVEPLLLLLFLVVL